MPTIKREILTKPMIESAKPAKRAYRLWDAKQPGLCLRVLVSGRRTWEAHWGRNRAVALGQYPTLTLEMARSRALAVMADASAHGTPAAARAPAAVINTLGDFIRERYAPHLLATAKAGAATVGNLQAQFGDLYDRPLASIALSDFDDFKAQRLRDGRHPSTVNRDMDRLKAALSQAVEWKLLAANPLRGVKRIKRGIEERVRYLSKSEENALRAALTARDRRATVRRDSGNAWRSQRGAEALPSIKGYADHLTPMVLLALNTGMRRGELTQLKPADVNLPAKLLTVRAGYAKSGKARHIPLNSEALKVLRAVLKRHSGDGRLFDVSAVAKSWEGVCTVAKLSDFRFHDLRHTFASKLVMGGIDLNTVRELLGHGDITMTLRYAHLAPEHKRAAVDVLVR